MPYAQAASISRPALVWRPAAARQRAWSTGQIIAFPTPASTGIESYRDADEAQVRRAVQPVGPEDREWRLWAKGSATN